MSIDAFVVFETAIDLPRFPIALVVEHICEYIEVALIERDPAISVIGDVGCTPEIVVDLTGCRMLIDRGEADQIFFRDGCPPLVFRQHRPQQRTFHRRLLHEPKQNPLLQKLC